MKITHFYKKSLSFCTEAFFPKRCLQCQKEGSWFCENHYFFPQNQNFYRYKHLNKVRARTFHQHKNSHLIIEELKFKGIKSLSKVCAKEMSPIIEQIKEPQSILVPVPLHWKRKLQRGFNQSELLAKEIQKNIPYLEINTKLLKRRHQTKQQSKLSKEERLKNIKDVFQCNTKEAAIPKSVILIDDIMTTGATLQSAAKALKKSGIEKVHAVVFSHG